MFVELSFGDFFCRLCNRRRSLRVYQTQLLVRFRRATFGEPQSANEWPRKSVTAYRKIQHRAMRGHAVESIRGHGHLAHRIFFDSRWFFRHAERSAPTPARRERLFLDVGPPPFAEGNLWKTVMNIGGIFCRKYSDSSRWKTVACCLNSLVTW